MRPGIYPALDIGAFHRKAVTSEPLLAKLEEAASELASHLKKAIPECVPELARAGRI